MKDYEIQSIVSLLERSAKALEKSDDYRHKELAKDSDYDVRISVARNPNTPVDVLAELANDINWYVRCFVAENPNTSADVLTELAKDSYWCVRRNAAGNPNTPGYEPQNMEFTVTETYVSIQGTNNVWYKHNYPNVAPFYTAGCFCGSREQLLMRIYTFDNQGRSAERMRILNALDEKFKEVFNR